MSADFWTGVIMTACVLFPVRIVFGTFVIYDHGRWVWKWQRFDDKESGE